MNRKRRRKWEKWKNGEGDRKRGKNLRKYDKRSLCVEKVPHWYLVFCGHAFPLLCRLLHSLTEGLGVLHHSFELRVCQHPQEVIQDQNQLGGHHVTVFDLNHTEELL